MGQIVDLYLIAYDERISNQQLLCTSLTTFRIQSSLILSINKQSQINKLNKKRLGNVCKFCMLSNSQHTSCGGTSYVLVRRSTRAYASTHGNMKNIPENSHRQTEINSMLLCRANE